MNFNYYEYYYYELLRSGLGRTREAPAAGAPRSLRKAG